MMKRGGVDSKGKAEGIKRKSEGRHSQFVEAVQSREGPVGVLYCARYVVMVQLPVENERKEGDKKDRRREGRRRTGTGSASTEALHSPGRGWPGSHGLPLHHSLPTSTSPSAPGLKSPSAALLCQPSAFFP